MTVVIFTSTDVNYTTSYVLSQAYKLGAMGSGPGGHVSLLYVPTFGLNPYFYLYHKIWQNNIKSDGTDSLDTGWLFQER